MDEQLESVIMAGATPDLQLAYLHSRAVSPPLDWYQITLLGESSTCVQTTCPRLLAYPKAKRLAVEPVTC